MIPDALFTAKDCYYRTGLGQVKNPPEEFA